jgi:hypothetical protein
VAENGEGLVRRMRDYERSQLSNDMYSRGRHKLPLSGSTQCLAPSTFAFDEDEDEVHFIQREEPPSILEIPCYISSESMDAESYIGSCSPDTHPQGPLPKIIPSRYLSQSSSRETSSATPFSALPSASDVTSLSTQPLAITAARSEKALTALTLAMANGAGSIDDYHTLRTLQKSSLSAADVNSAGELWD